MGYAKIFWIHEEPIRQYIAKNGIDDAMTLEVGRRVLSLGASDSHRSLGEPPMPLPFFDTPNVFFPFTSVHAKDFSLLLWTGDRLCRIPDASPAMFDTLCELSTLVGSSHLRLPLSEDEYRGVVEARHPQSDLKDRMHASVYWMYEDFSRDYLRVPESEWPMKDVGTATLDLMMSNWPRSKGVLWHGNAISRCCSVAKPECAVLVWSLNCLRAVSDVEPDELRRMRDYLSDRGYSKGPGAPGEHESAQQPPDPRKLGPLGQMILEYLEVACPLATKKMREDGSLDRYLLDRQESAQKLLAQLKKSNLPGYAVDEFLYQEINSPEPER